MAIALDAASSIGVGASPRTNNHTTSGAERLMLVAVYCSAGTDNATAVTYNSIPLTKIISAANRNYGKSLWYLIGPDTGTNQVSVTCSSGNVGFQVLTYTGVRQGAFPDGQDGDNSASAGSVTSTIVTTKDNCWTAMFVDSGSSNPAASTGSTIRVNGVPGGASAFDSNGAITPAGSYSMTSTITPDQTIESMMVSFAPPQPGGGQSRII